MHAKGKQFPRFGMTIDKCVLFYSVLVVLSVTTKTVDSVLPVCDANSKEINFSNQFIFLEQRHTKDCHRDSRTAWKLHKCIQNDTVKLNGC